MAIAIIIREIGGRGPGGKLAGPLGPVHRRLRAVGGWTSQKNHYPRPPAPADGRGSPADSGSGEQSPRNVR